jgi:hypothetical protein
MARETLYPRAPRGETPASFIRIDPAEVRRINALLPPALSLSTETGNYLYPPLVAILIAPLTVLPVDVAGLLWRAFLLAASAAGFFGIHRVLVRRYGLSPGVAAGIVLASVATWPFLYAIRLGQASALVFASVALAVWAVSERRLGWAGFALGVGVLVKLIPGLALVLFLFAPLRRTLWSALATIVVGTALTSLVVSPLDFVRFFQGMMPNVHEAAGRSNNQSVLACFAHLFVSPADRLRMPWSPDLLTPAVRTAALVASIAILAASLWTCLRAARRRLHADPASGALALDVAALALVGVALTTVALSHLFAVGAVAYALVLGRRAGDGRPMGVVDWGGVVLLQILWLVPPVLLPDELGGWPPARLLLSTTLAAAMATVVLAWRGRDGVAVVRS